MIFPRSSLFAAAGALFAAASANGQATSSAAASTDVAKFEYGTASGSYAGVVSQNANGDTNPDSPSLGTAINHSE